MPELAGLLGTAPAIDPDLASALSSYSEYFWARATPAIGSDGVTAADTAAWCRWAAECIASFVSESGDGWALWQELAFTYKGVQKRRAQPSLLARMSQCLYSHHTDT